MTINQKITGFITNFRESHLNLSKQVLSTIPSCLISLCAGVTFGMTSVMLPQLRKDTSIYYKASHESWIASASSLSMVFGSLGSGHVLDHYGRRIAHVAVGIPYIISWVTISCAQSTSTIIIGRLFTGLSTGANKAIMLVYIGEMASPRYRTITMLIPGILLNLGVLLSQTFGYHLDWRISSYLCIVPSVLISVTSLFLKESPLWLISKGRTEEGIKNFRWFRGTDDESEAELKAVLEKSFEKPKTSAKETLKAMCSSSFIKPMLILFAVGVNIQFSGIALIIFYSQDVFEQTFSGNLDPFIMIVVMDCVTTIVSICICFLGKYVSKKKCYLICDFGVSISVTGLVVCLIVGFEGFIWAPVTFLILFFCFSTGVYTIGWTFIPELLPSGARGLGSGLNTTFGSMVLFSVVKVMPSLMKAYGPIALYAFHGISTFIFGIILFFILPDTDGKTLQSIEDSYDKNNKHVNESTPL